MVGFLFGESLQDFEHGSFALAKAGVVELGRAQVFTLSTPQWKSEATPVASKIVIQAALRYNDAMIDKKRLELLLTTAESMGLQPQAANARGLISIVASGKKRYLFHKASNPNSAMATWLAENKYVARVIFEEHGLPNIPFCLPDNMQEAKNFLSAHGTIVAKPIKGMKSQDIHLIHDQDKLEKIEMGSYILEKFIKGQEVRLLVMSGQVVAVHHKVYESDINNPETVERVSLEEKDWDKQLEELAVRAADAIGLKFTAVDFLVTTSSAYLLEINSAPGIDRFQHPHQGPPVDAMRMYLQTVIDSLS